MGGRRGIISPSLLQGVLQTDGKTDIFSTFLNQTKTKQHFGFLARRERGRERDLLRMAKTVAGDINFVWGNCKDSYFFLRSDPLLPCFFAPFVGLAAWRQLTSLCRQRRQPYSPSMIYVPLLDTECCSGVTRLSYFPK